ncbi:Low specificity L-threonine aldolase [Roseovarius sp. THAF27]|uniref:threonine aldolase family protein n=1 Tax=Roseovarius sp. THAF27 TaxID=2587850 RepID=UPI00126784EC|nr:beta-eliminating lyase-related protein [Roseovarius sp. THAF27]QFT79561.1 Low specificity L-threonine aldolase [Roseovarius sp. THAF27]
MRLGSDNTGPALPEVIEALTRANDGHVPSYGADPLTEAAQNAVRDLFEAPGAAVHFVGTGTAANAIALASFAQPWQTAFCTPLAHILVDECHAPEFYTGGARLTPVGTGDKMSADDLAAAIAALPAGDVHTSQPGPVSLTQVTERGHLYTLEELRAICDVAHGHDLPVHLDGARFANACAALGCSPAQMSHAAGIDAVSFGASKNGCLGVEALVVFDPDKSWEVELRRKRAGHLFSKHRYLAAQMLGYLQDGAWLRAAQAANARAARLAEGLRYLPGCSFEAEPQANMIFATLPRATHQRLKAGGAVYGLYDGPLETGDPHEPLLMRLVCDWSITEQEIDAFLSLARD